MSFKRQADRGEPFRFPRLGQRIVKTSVAVFLCLLFYYLRGYSGRDMPTEAAITAIICMQPYVRGTRDYALSRFAGTLLGAGCGLLFLFLLLLFPVLGQNLLVLYALMALGMMLCLYGGLTSPGLPPSCSSAWSSPSRRSTSPCCRRSSVLPA